MDSDTAWLLIPLFHREEFVGAMMLQRPLGEVEFNWEIIDLLKAASRQAASVISQDLSAQALVKARQFEAYHKLSAFVIHDLKNLASQLSMVEQNAERHRNNPEFVDDAFETVALAVNKIHKLLKQLRSGVRGGALTMFDLKPMVRDVVHRRSSFQPVPELQADAVPHALVRGDEEGLGNVISHLVQNAQEATGRNGKVTVILSKTTTHAVIRVADDGCGMTEEFIKNRLFEPFDTTKGHSGMGIGVFETKELVRRLGGDITVRSTLNKGTTFEVMLPLANRESTEEE